MTARLAGFRVMRSIALMVCAALACGVGARSAQAQIPCGYEVAHVIQAPPCGIYSSPPTTGTGISPNGRYVCGYATCSFDGGRAWVYDTQGSQFSWLPHPAGISTSEASDVNDAAMVVGHMGGSGGSFAFIYNLNTGQYIAQIESLVNAGTAGFSAINASNIACGSRAIQANPTRSNAFTYDLASGQITDLGLINGLSTGATDINDNNVVTGTMTADSVITPFLWDGETIVSLGTLAGFNTWSLGMNNSNQVVGVGIVQASGPTLARAFHWSGGALQNLGVLPGYNNSTASRVNDAGFIIGRSSTAGAGVGEPFVWANGKMAALNPLLPGGVSLTFARALSQNGHILGDGVVAGNSRAIVLAPTISSEADLDHNCMVNFDDVLIVIFEWGNTKSLADINHDQVVNFEDLMIVLDQWTF